MTDKKPDASKAVNAPTYVSPNDPAHRAFVEAVGTSRRRALPAPPPKLARATVARAMADNAPIAAAMMVSDSPAATRPAASAPAHPIKVGATRDNAKKQVFVHGKPQVMAVFANPDGNYTVTGYGTRSHKGFGDFFLGMDAGAEYERQSRDINAAIQSITAEEGYALGLSGARAAYKTLNGGASVLDRVLDALDDTPDDDAPTVRDVSTQMLSAVTKDLFGIPDEDLIVTGPLRYTGGAPSHCPGDFAPVSASLFKPYPAPQLSGFGAYLGQLLAKQTGTLVARLRATGAPPPGRLTKVLFDKIPPDEDDRLVRTLIGAMMGLLPTIDGNLIEVMNGLQKNGEIARLKSEIAALGANPSYAQVGGVLKSAVYKAMQQAPVPEEVWRIAAHDHVISGDNPVSVKKGDMVVVSIESATRADLDNGVEDVSPVFGGLRTGRGRRPVHGCPGYAMAMGVIYGAVTGILQQPD